MAKYRTKDGGFEAICAHSGRYLVEHPDGHTITFYDGNFNFLFEPIPDAPSLESNSVSEWKCYAYSAASEHKNGRSSHLCSICRARSREEAVGLAVAAAELVWDRTEWNAPSIACVEVTKEWSNP